MEPVGNNPFLSILQPRDAPKNESTKKKDKAAFRAHMDSAKVALGSGEISEEEMARLLEEVWAAGGKLVREPGLSQVQDYRSAIAAFLDAIVRMSYTMENHTGILRKDHSRAQYTLVQVINQKLDGLAAAILKGQKDPMDILRRTDELKGLLIDLKH